MIALRCGLALVAVAAATGLSAGPADAARPLFLGTWSGKLQSNVVKGPNGRLSDRMSFERGSLMNFTAYRVRGIRKLRLRWSGGWASTRLFEVAHPCYRASYRYRLRPLRTVDMEGERVVTRARVRYLRTSRACGSRGFRNGNRSREWLTGIARRDEPPQRGGAEISHDSPNGCDPALVEHSAREDSSFLSWHDSYSYRWTFSDGGTSTDPSPRHRYPGPGEHTATVLIRERDGSVARGTQTVTVPPPEGCS